MQPNLPQRLLDLSSRLGPEDAATCRDAAECIERMDDYQAVFDELARARRKFPTWPTDPLHAVGVVGEEFGELTKAVLQHTYEPQKSSLNDVRSESVQTAAMALRFFVSLDTYQFTKCDQHMQAGYSTESAAKAAKETRRPSTSTPCAALSTTSRACSKSFR